MYGLVENIMLDLKIRHLIGVNERIIDKTTQSLNVIGYRLQISRQGISQKNKKTLDKGYFLATFAIPNGKFYSKPKWWNW